MITALDALIPEGLQNGGILIYPLFISWNSFVKRNFPSSTIWLPNIGKAG